MSSVAQIVRQLIDQLSDGVSQLVLLVVTLQDQNADVPQHLPPAVNQVVQTSGMLVKVAHQLASVNYKNYDSIAEEIRSSADAVTTASATMGPALSALAGPDKVKGWSTLIEACRVVSTRTIRLLQIVYSSELKRLFHVANAVLTGVGQADTAAAVTDPEGFAEWATALATQANQLAAYIGSRSKDEQSPMAKQILDEFALKLKSSAKNIINSVNDLLDNPESAELKEAVHHQCAEIQDIIGEATLWLKENSPELTKFDESSLPSLALAMEAKRNAKLEQAKKDREAEELRLEEIKAQRRAAAEAARLSVAVQQVVQPPDYSSILARDIERTRGALVRLQEAALARDRDALISESDHLAQAFSDLKKGANEEAMTTLDPVRRQQILAALKSLEQSVPGQLALAQRVLENPTGNENKVALRKVAIDNSNSLAQLEAATRTVDLLERAMRADRAVELIARAVADKKPTNDRMILGDDFARLNTQVIGLAQFQAQNALSEDRAQAMAIAIKRLMDASSMLTNVSHIQDVTKPESIDIEPVDVAAKEYKAALNDLQAQTNSLAVGTLSALVRDIDSAQRASLAENRTALQAVSVQMVRDGKSALEAAKKALTGPAFTKPDEQERLKAAIKEVDDRLKDELLCIRKFMDIGTGTTPAAIAKRKEAQTKVALAERPLRDAIAYLEQVLIGQVPEMEYMVLSPGDEAALAKSAIEVSDMAGQIIDLAQIMKENNSGTSASVKAQQELETLLSSIQGETKAIIETLSTEDPDEEVVAKAAETIEFIRQLRKAVNDSPEAIVACSKRLSSIVQDLLGEIKHAAVTADNDTKEQLENHSAAIGSLIGETLVCTKGVLATGDSSSKAALQSKTLDLQRAIQRAQATVRPEDHDERIMRNMATSIHEELTEVDDLLISRAPENEVDNKVSLLSKHSREYLRAAQKRRLHRGKRALVVDKDKTEDILAEFKSLVERIGHPALDTVRSGKEKPHQEFRDISSKIRVVLVTNNEDYIADHVAAFQDVDEGIARIEDAVERGDTARVEKEAARVEKLLLTLEPIVLLQSPSVHEDLYKAIDEIQLRAKQTIDEAFSCLKSPGKTRVFMETAADDTRVPIAHAIALLSPCEDRSVIERVRQAQAAIAAASGTASKAADPKSTIRTKTDAAKTKAAAAVAVREAISATTEHAAKQKNPQKRRHVEKAAAQVQTQLETLETLDVAADQFQVKTLDVKDSLGGLYSMVSSDTKTDVAILAGQIKAGAKEMADFVAASQGKPIDQKGLDARKQNLSEKMEDLRDSALGLGQGTTMPATMAPSGTTLDSLLDGIESSFTPPSNVHADLEELIRKFKGVTEAPTNFEDALEHAAYNIVTALQSTSQGSQAPEVIASNNLAVAMARLAKHARKGERQEMLKCSRDIATYLEQLTNEINNTTSKLSNKPREADALIRATTALKNYGTQLKILVSVKAASIEKDLDNDETLLSISMGLGHQVANSVRNIDTAKRVILKQKN